MAELEQLHTAHMQEIQQRSTAGGDERNLDGAQHERIEAGSGTVRVAGPKDPPQVATLRRASDVVENLRVPMESLPHRTGQEISRAPGQNRRPHQRRSHRRLDLENQKLSMQLYFALVLVML